MGIYQAPLPGGGSQPFTIKGDAPSESEQGRIEAWIKTNIPDLTPPKPAADEGGFGSSFGHAFGEVFHGLKMAPETTLGATGDTNALRALKADADARAGEAPKELSFDDAYKGGIGSLWQYGKEQAGELTGGLAGTAVAAAPTFLAGGIGGLVGMGAVGAVNSTRQMLLAQMGPGGRTPEEVNGGVAAAAGLASGAIGVLPPGRFLGKFAAGAGMRIAEKASEGALEKLAAAPVTREMAKGIAGEAGTMAAYNAGISMGDTALTRWQAGQEVMSPEGLKEIGEAGVKGAVGGVAMGAVAGAYTGARMPAAARAELGRRDARDVLHAEAGAEDAARNPPPSPAPDADKPTVWEAPPGTPPEYGPPRQGPTVWEGGEPPPGPANAVPMAETVAKVLPTVQSALGRALTNAERMSLEEQLQKTPEAQRGIAIRGFINGLRNVREDPGAPPGTRPTAWEAPPNVEPQAGPPRQGPTVWEGAPATQAAANAVPMAETVKAATRQAEAALGRPLSGEEVAALEKALPGVPEANRGIFMRNFQQGLRRVAEEEKARQAAPKPPAEPLPPTPETPAALTEAEVQQLRARGFSDDHIAQLTPDMARTAIEGWPEQAAPQAEPAAPTETGVKPRAKRQTAAEKQAAADEAARNNDRLVAEEQARQKAEKDAADAEAKKPAAADGGAEEATTGTPAAPTKPETTPKATTGALVYTKKEDGLRWNQNGRLHHVDRALVRNSNEQLANQIDRIQSSMHPTLAKEALQERLAQALSSGNATPHDIAQLRDAVADRSTRRKPTNREKFEKITGKRQAAAEKRAAKPAPPPPPAKAVVKGALNRPTRSAKDQEARTRQINEAVSQVWKRLGGRKVPGIPDEATLRNIVERFDTVHPNDDAMAIASNHVQWRLSDGKLDTPYKAPPKGRLEPNAMEAALRKAAGEEEASASMRDPYDTPPPPDPWHQGFENLNDEHEALNQAILHLSNHHAKAIPTAELRKLVNWLDEFTGGGDTAAGKRARLELLEEQYGADRTNSKADPRIKLDHEYTLNDLAKLLGHRLSKIDQVFLARALRLAGDTPVFVAQEKHVNNAWTEKKYIPKDENRPLVMMDDHNVEGFFSVNDRPHIMIGDVANPEVLARVLLHEALHPVFNRALETNKAFAAKVQALYNEVKRQHPKGHPMPYGMNENLREFFTEGMSRSQFKSYLETITLSPEYVQKAGLASWVRTAWDGLVDKMREALNMPNRRGVFTALDEMMRLADEGFNMREGAAGITEPIPTGGAYAAMRPQGGFNVGLPGGPVGQASPNVMQGAHQGGANLPGNRFPPQTPANYNASALHVTNGHTVNFLRKLFGTISKLLTGDRVAGEKVAEWYARGQIDRYRPLDKLVQDIRENGVVGRGDDSYAMMQASHGRIARANDEMFSRFKNDFANFVNANGLKDSVESPPVNGVRSDRSVAGVARLMAEKQRNEYGRQKNPNDPPWSGIDDAEIAQRQQALMNDPTFNYALHEQAANLLFDFVQNNISKTREDYGLIAPGMTGMGAHWLPLRSQEANAAAGEEVMRSPFAGRLGIGARNDPRTIGRHTRSEDSILANVLNLAQDANRHGIHNEALQALFRLGQDPNNHGLVVSHGTNGAYIPDGHKIMVKFNGDQHFMETADRRVANMFNTVQQQSEAVAGLLGMHQKVNNWLRKASTVMSPEFIIANAVRDNIEAAAKALGLKGSGLNVDAITKASVLGFVPARKAMVALRHANETRDVFQPRNAWEQAAVEFAQHGGEAVSWGDTRKTTERNIQDMFHDQDVGTIRKAGRTIESLLEVQGGAIENATRLSAFKALRDQGVSAEEAAGYARNVTVNFAQRGEWAPVLNSLYLFYNAGMQGTVGMFNAALRPGPGGDKVRAMLGGVVAMGAFSAIANNMLMGEDESGMSKWAGIPDYEKQSNIILAMPWTEKGYAKIPLPHGLAALANLGRVAAEMATNPPQSAKQMTERAGNAMGNILEQLLPFGQTNSFANFITPTILRPVWQMHAGEDALGRQLSPDQASARPGEKKAPSQNFWNSAAPSSVAIADWLHNNTGGQGTHVLGAVEIPPGQISNLIQNLTGGAGSFLSRAFNFTGRRAGVFEPKSDLEGEQWGDVPVVRRFVGDLDNSRIVQSQFLDAQERINSVGKEYDEIMKNPTTESGNQIQRLMDAHGDELIAYQAVKSMGKSYSKMGTSMHSIQNSEMDSTTKKEILDAMKGQRTQLQRQMMKVYHDLGAI